ncbi:unnamed protein product [Chrysoparadoxa australica]
MHGAAGRGRLCQLCHARQGVKEGRGKMRPRAEAALWGYQARRAKTMVPSARAASSSTVVETEAPVPPSPPPSMLKGYLDLSKARLSSLVVFTTSAGYLAAGGPVEVLPMSAACIGTALAAASASTFNQVIETRNDSQMRRTQNRPLPSGLISRNQALAWGGSTGAASFGLLAAGTNPLTTALGVGNIFLYAVPYTLSKTRTELNTWIGSVVGAVPPVMGWVAATGSIVAPEPALLASYLFLWQFPHFFALSWMYRQDYARGGFKMVACADPTGQRSADLIAKYSVLLTPLPIIAAASGVTSWMFAVEGTAMNAYLLLQAWRFYQDRSNGRARDIFKTSLWYLPASLALFVYHSRHWLEEENNTQHAGNVGLLNRYTSAVRERMRGLCVHELIAADEAVKDQGQAYCPKVVGDAAVDTAVETAKVVGETAAVVASTPDSAKAAS